MWQLAIALPVILPVLVLAGLLEVMIPEEFIKSWLAQEAGFTGIILGVFGGMIMAFGPYASYPIIATIYNSGAGLGTTVSLIAGWTFLGLSIDCRKSYEYLPCPLCISYNLANP